MADVALPIWLLVLLTLSIYSIVNGLVLGYQLSRTFHIGRLAYLCKTSIINSMVSAFLVLACQSLFIVYFSWLENLACTWLGFEPERCPFVINITRLLVQSSVIVVAIFGGLKILVQRHMLHEQYHITTGAVWRMLVISNSIACAVQYLVLCVWM